MKKLSEVAIKNLQTMLNRCITDEHENVSDLGILIEHTAGNMLRVSYRTPKENEAGIAFAIKTSIKHFVRMQDTDLDLSSGEISGNRQLSHIEYWYVAEKVR